MAYIAVPFSTRSADPKPLLNKNYVLKKQYDIKTGNRYRNSK
jgi:hypothetical protein